MFEPSSIDAVVFDIGGVFLVPHPAPVREVLAPVGLALLDDDAFHRAHYRGVHAVAALHIDETDPAFSPDGTRLAVYGDELLSLWEIATWKADAWRAPTGSLTGWGRSGILIDQISPLEVVLLEP